MSCRYPVGVDHLQSASKRIAAIHTANGHDHRTGRLSQETGTRRFRLAATESSTQQRKRWKHRQK
jgi:hypothetical protein